MLYPRIAKINGKDTVIENTQCVSYEEHMLNKHRLFFLTGVITGETNYYNLLMAMDTLSHDPIKIVITSPGGDLDSTFLFYDTIKLIQSPIITIGRYCASAGAILLAAGSKRYLYPHAKVMLHLPAGQMGGDARDWDIQHKQMQRYKDKVVDLLCECGAKKNREELLADMDRDYWMEPEEAIEYGLCDEILTPKVWGEWINGT